MVLRWDKLSHLKLTGEAAQGDLGDASLAKWAECAHFSRDRT